MHIFQANFFLITISSTLTMFNFCHWIPENWYPRPVLRLTLFPPTSPMEEVRGHDEQVPLKRGAEKHLHVYVSKFRRGGFRMRSNT